MYFVKTAGVMIAFLLIVAMIYQLRNAKKHVR